MKIAGTYKTSAKSLVFLGVLSLAQLAQATESVGKGDKLAYDAKKQIGVTTSYDPTYRQLDFPRGDVLIETGVCTDVVVRAYRLQNIDLPHMGIVSNKVAADGSPLIIHNIGRGTQEENILFAYPIHKHFRY